MDQDTKIIELKEQIRIFCEERDWGQYHSLKDLAIGAVTESSELLEIFRFKSDAEIELMLKNPAQRENISDELADVLFFVLRIAQKYQFDLTTAFTSKMKKNSLKYSVEKSRGQNKKYTEL